MYHGAVDVVLTSKCKAGSERRRGRNERRGAKEREGDEFAGIRTVQMLPKCRADGGVGVGCVCSQSAASKPPSSAAAAPAAPA